MLCQIFFHNSSKYTQLRKGSQESDNSISTPIGQLKDAVMTPFIKIWSFLLKYGVPFAKNCFCTAVGKFISNYVRFKKLYCSAYTA